MHASGRELLLPMQFEIGKIAATGDLNCSQSIWRRGKTEKHTAGSVHDPRVAKSRPVSQSSPHVGQVASSLSLFPARTRWSGFRALSSSQMFRGTEHSLRSASIAIRPGSSAGGSGFVALGLRSYSQFLPRLGSNDPKVSRERQQIWRPAASSSTPADGGRLPRIASSAQRQPQGQPSC